MKAVVQHFQFMSTIVKKHKPSFCTSMQSLIDFFAHYEIEICKLLQIVIFAFWPKVIMLPPPLTHNVLQYYVKSNKIRRYKLQITQSGESREAGESGTERESCPLNLI